jgi:hypothetical protein
MECSRGGAHRCYSPRDAWTGIADRCHHSRLTAPTDCVDHGRCNKPIYLPLFQTAGMIEKAVQYCEEKGASFTGQGANQSNGDEKPSSQAPQARQKDQ